MQELPSTGSAETPQVQPRLYAPIDLHAGMHVMSLILQLWFTSHVLVLMVMPAFMTSHTKICNRPARVPFISNSYLAFICPDTLPRILTDSVRRLPFASTGCMGTPPRSSTGMHAAFMPLHYFGLKTGLMSLTILGHQLPVVIHVSLLDAL